MIAILEKKKPVSELFWVKLYPDPRPKEDVT